MTTTVTIDQSIPAVSHEERAQRLAAVNAWAASLERQPQNATLAVHVTGESVGSVATVLQARNHTLIVDEPTALAGEDLAANPVEYALAGLIACQVVTYRVWAAKLGIELDEVQITADGALDTRGFFGIDDAVRPGFQGINVNVHLTGPESDERYRELQEAVDAHCPVQDLFANPTPFSASLAINEAR